MAYLLLDGTGDYAYTPDAAVLDITGDLMLVARIRPASWSTGQMVIAKGADSAYQVNLVSGLLRFTWKSSSGTVGVNSAAHSLTDNTDAWIKVEFDVDNGAGGYDLSFYKSTDDTNDPSAVSWTQIGTTTTGGSTTDIVADTRRLTVGANSSDSLPFNGRIYRAQVYSGIAGTLVFDADFSDPTTWTFS